VVDKISLSAAARTNLLALQNTSQLIGRTQDRLSSGLAVKGPTDDAVKYFQAKSLSSRAQDLTERKDAIDQGVSTLEATLHATGSMEKLVSQLKGIVNAARSQTQSERAEAKNQLKELASQIQKLVDDATYKGVNLLNSTGSTLTVRFSDKATSKLDVAGVDFRVSKFFLLTGGAAQTHFKAGDAGSKVGAGLGLIATAAGTFGNALTKYDFAKASEVAKFNARADTAILRLETTISNLRAKAATMATNSDILKIRLDFTSEYTNVLQAGADKLTLADLNTEGANLLALQTRQQLGIQALAFAGQSEQSILSLFR
jgi:flagellin